MVKSVWKTSSKGRSSSWIWKRSIIFWQKERLSILFEGWGSRRREGDLWNVGPVFESLASDVAQHRAKAQAVDSFGQEQVQQKFWNQQNLKWKWIEGQWKKRGEREKAGKLQPASPSTLMDQNLLRHESPRI